MGGEELLELGAAENNAFVFLRPPLWVPLLYMKIFMLPLLMVVSLVGSAMCFQLHAVPTIVSTQLSSYMSTCAATGFA